MTDPPIQVTYCTVCHTFRYRQASCAGDDACSIRRATGGVGPS